VATEEAVVTEEMTVVVVDKVVANAETAVKDNKQVPITK
jgi:hypothetical protein